jgi:hypothetical protein
MDDKRARDNSYCIPGMPYIGQGTGMELKNLIQGRLLHE